MGTLFAESKEKEGRKGAFDIAISINMTQIELLSFLCSVIGKFMSEQGPDTIHLVNEVLSAELASAYAKQVSAFSVLNPLPQVSQIPPLSFGQFHPGGVETGFKPPGDLGTITTKPGENWKLNPRKDG